MNMPDKTQTSGEVGQVPIRCSRFRLANSKLSLSQLFILAASLAVISALVRHEPRRVIGLVAGGCIASAAIAPCLVWLFRAFWYDLWLPGVQRRWGDVLVWFHWQRSQALLGLILLVILWAAVENELMQQASIRASVLPPIVLAITLTWAVVARLRR